MEILKTIICSTAHFTLNDNELLNEFAIDNLDEGYSNYIFSFQEGYLLRLYAVRNPVLDLKKIGISKALRKFIITMMNIHNVDIIIFDMDGDILKGFEIFDW